MDSPSPSYNNLWYYLDPRWSKVMDIYQLSDINSDFVMGLLDSTPSHGGPLEDKELGPMLKEMNQRLLITIDGQRSILDDQLQQRSYVEFFRPYSPQWHQVELRLLHDPLLDVIIVDLNKGKRTLVSYKVHNQNLTRERDSPKDRWELYTNLPNPDVLRNIDIIGKVWRVTPNIMDVFYNGHYRWVTVAIKPYGVGSVEKIILDYMQHK